MVFFVYEITDSAFLQGFCLIPIPSKGWEKTMVLLPLPGHLMTCWIPTGMPVFLLLLFSLFLSGKRGVPTARSQEIKRQLVVGFFGGAVGVVGWLPEPGREGKGGKENRSHPQRWGFMGCDFFFLSFFLLFAFYIELYLIPLVLITYQIDEVGYSPSHMGVEAVSAGSPLPLPHSPPLSSSMDEGKGTLEGKGLARSRSASIKVCGFD
ncbi:hypothetical protein F4778DRAFT_479243 [Xylariomycetidae sp. FL2044]|nr:hypothetical protein F4778DRAFT_479243 [Xylariomycetidae sp. FL2044]